MLLVDMVCGRRRYHWELGIGMNYFFEFDWCTPQGTEPHIALLV